MDEMIGNQTREASGHMKGVSMVLVEQNPEEYIETSCIPACKVFWSKNIFTKACSKNTDKNIRFIALTGLSPENQERYVKLAGEEDSCFYPDGYIVVPAVNAEKELLKLANLFEMQDVYIKEAYMNAEEFLISQGCYSLGRDLQKQFDASKMVQSFQDYLEEEGALDLVVTRGTTDGYALQINDKFKMFSSHYYLEKHKNYLKYLEDKNSEEKE